MEFYIDFDDQTYLVRIKEFRKNSRKKIVFSNSGLDQFELELFLASDEQLTAVSILEQSEIFQNELSSILTSILPQTMTLVPNPFFDEVIIFYGNTIFTTQEKLKRIDCETCKLPDLYQKREKGNKTEYKNDVQKKLVSNPHPNWPFKGDLMIQITISDSVSRLKSADLDNLSKSILDSLKGLAFEDDRQIVALFAEKKSVLNVTAYIVAIRKMAIDERPKFQDSAYSSYKFEWEDGHRENDKSGKFSRIVVF